MFQSTRPRGARPRSNDNGKYFAVVSIHAPARGATNRIRCERMAKAVFQSTRPRGARHNYSGLIYYLICFNPRAREGRDGGLAFVRLFQRVSIHAPARGATPRDAARAATATFQSTRPRGARLFHFPSCLTVVRRFNPRAREGRDRETNETICDPECFNPRAREGRDLIFWLSANITNRFNPRAREGRDAGKR